LVASQVLTALKNLSNQEIGCSIQPLDKLY
jgi:hypothetical protein